MLSNPLKVNTKANIWFGVFLFLWASFWLEEILTLIKARQPGELLSLVITFFQFLTPLVFYLSIIFFTNPNYKFKSRSLLFCILPFIYLLLLLIDQTTGIPLKTINILLICIHALIYSYLIYLKIRKHQQQIHLFSSNTLEINLKWLEYIVWVIIFISIIITVFNFVYFGLPLNLYINIIMLLTALFIAYHALRQKEVFPLNKKHREEIITIEDENTNESSPTTKRKLLEDKELFRLKSNLDLLMKEKKLYLDHDINVASLAEEMNITSHQLSYIINTGYNQNFFNFINGYRIKKAKTLLLDKSADTLTMLGIAYESGFSSKTAFNTTFKKLTNQTPTEFKKKRSSL